MQQLVDRFFNLLEAVMVVCMAVMFVMVFGNVVLRAGFNSGIDVSEELPRFLFIWLTFIGAVVAMRENRHLGVDTVVLALPVRWRRACWMVSQILIFVVAVYIFVGTFMQHEINAATVSTVMQLPMSWVYGVTYFTGALMAAMCVHNLLRLARGQVRDDELVQVEEEGMHEIDSTVEAVRK
ncbi:MAG: ABC transporter permease [Kaistia sp. SCN 65-12]|nr:MAG: ABC transporter permease [Kaistia sp. SCN 65-12]